MAFLAIIRDLWRHRRLVFLGTLIALAAMVLVMFRVSFEGGLKLESRKYEVGVASTAMQIDSTSSQAIDLGDPDVLEVDVAMLAARAKLMANLLVTRPFRESIARDSGVAPDTLITELSSTTDEGEPPPVASDVKVDRDDPAANIVALQTSETVPIITVNAQAPTQRTASRLATSTVTALRDYLLRLNSERNVPPDRKLVMRELGQPTATISRRGPGTTQAVAIFIVLLGLSCGSVLAFAALSRALWQQTAADDYADGRDLLALQLPPDPEDEQPAGTGPRRVGERGDDELWLPPTEDTSSRVA
jgi:hypothetical protein